MTDRDWHISSLIVHSRPDRHGGVKRKVEDIAGVEVHADDERGKLVVTAEGGSEGAVVDSIDRINRIEGILSTVLVYHHSEDADSLEEEIDDEADTQRVY